MNRYILLLLISSSASAQSNCCYPVTADPDTTICMSSVQLHAKINSSILFCKTYGTPRDQGDYDETGYTINGSLSAGDYAGCGPGAKLMIAVIDSVCPTAWSNNGLNYGQLNTYPTNDFCRGRPENFFQFSFTSPSEMTSAVNMLKTIVPVNDYLLVYTFQTDTLSKFAALADELDSLGATAINNLQNVPFIFFVQKGKPNTAQQNIGANDSSIITLTTTMNSSHTFQNTTFSWSPGGTLNDSTIQSPVATPTDTTTYILTATDTLYHCTSIDSVNVYYTCLAGVKENEILNAVHVYPNPSTDRINITSTSVKLKKVLLTNAIGQLISDKNCVNASNETINTDYLAEGIYFLKIETDFGEINRKIVCVK